MREVSQSCKHVDKREFAHSIDREKAEKETIQECLPNKKKQSPKKKRSRRQLR